MKKIKIIFFLFSFCSLVNAQPIRFQRTYGFSTYDYLQSKQTPDGGYILYGGKNYNAHNQVILIIKTDSAGTITWAKTYDYPSGNYVWDLEILNNSYLISCSNSNITSGFLLKIDLVGNVILIKTNIIAEFIVRTSNGGFVVSSSDIATGVLTKLDSNLNIVWRKKYDVPGANDFCSLKKALDGGFLITGMINNGFNNSQDFNLTKTDSLGNVLWSKMYGGNGTDWYPFVEPTLDGGSIMVGSTDSYGAGYDDVFLIKLDGIGNVQWAKTFGGTLTDDGAFVKQTFGSIGYIITGVTQGFSTDDSLTPLRTRSFLIKTDINGNFQWARRYGLGPQDNAVTVWQTQDAGYVFSGSTGTWGAGDTDGWMVKTDNMGLSGCYDWPTIPTVTSPTILDSTLTFTESNDTLTIGNGTIFDSVVSPFTTIECLSGPNGTGIKELSNENSIDIFPNPSNGKFHVQSSDLNIQNIEIYNMFGEKIYSLTNLYFTRSTEIDLSSQAAGIYFVRVNTKEGTISKKIMLTK